MCLCILQQSTIMKEFCSNNHVFAPKIQQSINARSFLFIYRLKGIFSILKLFFKHFIVIITSTRHDRALKRSFHNTSLQVSWRVRATSMYGGSLSMYRSATWSLAPGPTTAGYWTSKCWRSTFLPTYPTGSGTSSVRVKLLW